MRVYQLFIDETKKDKLANKFTFKSSRETQSTRRNRFFLSLHHTKINRLEGNQSQKVTTNFCQKPLIFKQVLAQDEKKIKLLGHFSKKQYLKMKKNHLAEYYGRMTDCSGMKQNQRKIGLSYSLYQQKINFPQTLTQFHLNLPLKQTNIQKKQESNKQKAVSCSKKNNKYKKLPLKNQNIFSNILLRTKLRSDENNSDITIKIEKSVHKIQPQSAIKLQIEKNKLKKKCQKYFVSENSQQPQKIYEMNKSQVLQRKFI